MAVEIGYFGSLSTDLSVNFHLMVLFFFLFVPRDCIFTIICLFGGMK